MLKKLSRIFCVTGSALALLVFLYSIFNSSHSYGIYLLGMLYNSLSDAVTVIRILTAAASLVGVFFINRKPVLAGILMIISGEFVIPFFLPSSALISFLVLLISMLLSAAGVLALIGAYNTPGSEARLVLKKLSFTTGVTSAALYTLISLTLTAFKAYMLPDLIFSTAGLLGSLLVRKKTVPGSVLMLLFGAYILTSRSRMLWPTALLLIAAGVLGLIGAYNTSGGRALPVLMKLSIIAGITGAVLIMAPLLDFTSYDFNLTMGGYSIIWLRIPGLIASAVGLCGSLLLHKKPLPGALLVLLTGMFFIGPHVTPVLLIASGVLAVISRMRTSAFEELQDKT